MDVAHEFDSISREYTEKINRWLPYYQKMITGLIEYLPEGLQARNILDLGVGNGNVTTLLLRKFPEAYYTLLDASTEMIHACEERFVSFPRIDYRLLFFQEAEFQEEHFDLVTCGIALHHLEANEKREFFSKVYDWLRPHGVFVFSDLFVDRQNEPYHSSIISTWKEAAFALGTTDDEWAWIMDHYDKYDFPDSFDNQTRWLKEAGFEEVFIPWREHAWGVVLAMKG